MPTPIEQLSNPPLRPVWANAKKQGEAQSKLAKEGDKYAALTKKFTIDLGPDLESWPKLYPNFPKMKEVKAKIDKTVQQYQSAIKSSGLSANTQKLLQQGLEKISSEMDKRLVLAENLVSHDLDAAIKDSKQKQIPPLVIFKQDIAKQVSAKAGKAAEIMHVDSLPIEAILTDPKVLKNVPADLDDAVLAKEIREKASFQTLIDDIAKELQDAAAIVTKNPQAGASAKAVFEAGVEKAIEASLNRAAEPVLRYTKVKADYRAYKIKAGVQLTITTAGAIGGVIGLALTPLTFGVSTVAGAIGIAKSGIALGQQIANLASDAEGIAARVAEDIIKVGTQYKNASSTLVGAGELGKTLVNATLPTMFTTIKSCKGDVDLLEQKINGLEVKTHDTARDLGALLTKQADMQRALTGFEKYSKEVLSGSEVAALTKLIKAVDATGPVVERMIKKIEDLYARVKKTSEQHQVLKQAATRLAAKEPTWAQVGEILINVAAGVGFMVAGGVNAPDPYKFVKTVADINSDIGYAVSSLDAAKSAFEDVKDLVESKKKK